jgi:hypothetical protein
MANRRGFRIQTFRSPRSTGPMNVRRLSRISGKRRTNRAGGFFAAQPVIACAVR